MESPVPLFTAFGFDVDTPLFLSLVTILFLGILQLSWPAIQKWFQPQPVRTTEMPTIETVSADKQKEKPRRRFVKDKGSIADWAAQDPATDLDKYQDTAETSLQDPNTILPAGLEVMNAADVNVDENGQVLDLDGSVIEEGTIAYIRQQIIDRVINTGTTDADENDEAVMKVDIIKSIRQLTDREIVEWYIHNKSLLKY